MSNPPILSHLSPIYANIVLQANITVLPSLILPQIAIQSHWNLSTQIYMVLFQSKLLTNIAIGSVSSMTVPITEPSTCCTRNLMPLLHSRSLKHLLKSKQAIRLRHCVTTKGGST